MSLNVTIPDTFNGPLDLLLHLIRRDEMDIYDIPVSRLTNSYLEEMEKLEIIDVDEGAEFLDLASRLLEIKSRMLIPPDGPEDAQEEEDEDFDPRTGLVEALLEYRRFKDAAKLLGDMAEEQSRRYPRAAPRMEFDVSSPDADGADAGGAGANDLMRAFQNLLDRMLPDFSDAPDVITYTEVSIATRAAQITENLAVLGTTRFSRLLSDAPTKSEMVGLFIAMLELVRLGKIIARQSENFSDIIIEHRLAYPEIAPHREKYVSLSPVSFFPAIARICKRAEVKNAVKTPVVFPPPPRVSPVSGRDSGRILRSGAARALPAFRPCGLFPAIRGKSRTISRKKA